MRAGLLATLGLLLIGACTAPLRAAEPISLVDHNGQAIELSELQSRPSVVVFGFMNCPAICPTTLYHAASLLQKLGHEGDQLQILFVTVDPERDTPQNLASYVSAFDDRIIGLTGTGENIARFAATLGARYEKVAAGENDYTMNHTVHSFLLKRGWRNKTTVYIGPDADIAAAMTKLKQLIASRAQAGVAPSIRERASPVALLPQAKPRLE